jgi:PAS domain S-box-containing protein
LIGNRRHENKKKPGSQSQEESLIKNMDKFFVKIKTMLSRIRRIFAPPKFPDDEDKTRQARLLNTLFVSAMLFLFFLGLIAVPFIFVEKLYNTLAGLAFIVTLWGEYMLMRRGRVRLASVLFLMSFWLIFTFFLFFSGGMTSILVIFYLVGTVIAGLLLGTRGTLIYIAASSLAGLIMVVLDTSGHSLPRIFPVPPIAGWTDMTIALLVLAVVLRLVLGDLQDALLLTRQNLEERRQAEEVSRRADAALAEAQRISHLGSWDWDLGTDKIRFSDEMFRLVGMLPRNAEITREAFTKFLHPDEAERILQEFWQSTASSFDIEHRIVQPDGKMLYVQSRIKAYCDENGTSLRLLGSTQDITERKRAEEALARQVERLQALHKIDQAITSSMDLNTILNLLVREVVEQLHVDATAVLLLDPQKQVLIFTAGQGFRTKALRFTSLKVGSGLAGRAVNERKTVYVASLAEIDNNPILIKSIAKEKFVTYFGVPLIAKGEVCGVLEIFHRSALVPDPSWLTFLETLAGQAAISIDHARLLEMTQGSLKETNALYRINQDLVATVEPEQLMENVVNLLQENFGYYLVQIYVMDPETGDFVVRAGSGEIGKQLVRQEYRLAAGEGIVGYTAETGAPFFTNDVNQLITFVRNPLLPDTKSELAVPIKTGTKFLGLLDIHQVPPAYLTERDVQLVSAIADQLAVALQKAQLYADLQDSLRQEQTARSQLIHAEKLAVAGRLLASVSHELNNPLQAIQNALFLLKDEGELSRQGQQDLKIVLSETERMATLLERLRTTYQPAWVEDFQPVQINSIIEDVHSLVTTHLRHAQISFEFHPNPGLPSISGLADQLRQVILNLFINAVDAMADGGHLIVSTSWRVETREILISVADTGMGIDESLLPNIFEAFITNKQKGTGLGLAISYEIVLKHQGRIQAENNPEGGATFSIWLPIENGGAQ